MSGACLVDIEQSFDWPFPLSACTYQHIQQEPHCLSIAACRLGLHSICKSLALECPLAPTAGPGFAPAPTVYPGFAPAADITIQVSADMDGSRRSTEPDPATPSRTSSKLGSRHSSDGFVDEAELYEMEELIQEKPRDVVQFIQEEGRHPTS